MNKTLLFILLISTVALSSLAQTTTKPELSFGAEFGLPLIQPAYVYGTVFGASAKLELPVSNIPSYITFTAGITEYAIRLDYQGDANPATFIPLEAGVKVYFSKIGYVEGDAGMSISANNNFPGPKDAFIVSPIIGFSAPTPKHKATSDVGLRYEERIVNNRSIGQIALRVAYRFGL
jgi:hypothetical protein